MEHIPLHDAKDRLSAVVHGVEAGRPVEITRHGKPVAVLIDRDSYEHLRDQAGTFAHRYARFRDAWPAEESDGTDPFEGTRAASLGREVNL